MKECKKCHINKPYVDFYKLTKSADGYHNSCKLCVYHNKESKEKLEKYYIKNKTSIKIKVVSYQKNRKSNDSIYKLRCILSKKTSGYLKSKRTRKTQKSFIKLFGVDRPTAMNHIERQFKKGMNWENRGVFWVVDHIIPLSAAKTEDELYQLCHYTNLQPLLYEENSSKSATIEKIQLKILI